jgi:hypothetical protein
MALERAWGRWRVMHGLGTDPLPPVSSYVGYSLEEPWGQPRVVFGVGAEEAERLAALLAGHDCVGPVHAEVTARPDWRLAASADPATAQGRPFEAAVSVPAQAPPPGAEPAAERDIRTIGADFAGTGTTEAYRPGAGSAYADADYGDAAYADSAYTDTGYGGPADTHDAERGEDVDAGDRAVPDEAPPGTPPRSWQRGEPAGTVQLAAAEQPGVIAFPRRPQQPADQWQEPIPAEADASDNYDATPSQGPGYCGPRYQGVPPQYQSGPSLQEPTALFGTGTEGVAEQAGAGESGTTRASATGPSASRPGASPAIAEQSGAEQAREGQSREGQSREGRPGTGPGAGQPGAAKPEAVQADASPAVARPKAGPSRFSRPTGGEPEAMQSAAVQPKAVESKAGQSKGGQSGVRQSKARDSSVDAREAGRSGAVQSGEGQSGEGQSGEGQSGQGQSGQGQSGTGPETRQPRVTPSRGAQPRTPQPKAVPSKPAQSRQTSRPNSPRRATGEATGKGPRG